MAGPEVELSQERANFSEKDAKKSQQVVFMSAVAEAAHLLKLAAEPRPVGDTVKQAINRAARRVSRFLREPMHAGRAEDIWRARARLIRAEEMDALRKAAQQDRLAQEARNEFAELTARIARLEALALLQRPDLDSAEADALRAMARGQDRPMD